jgi:hypothetical protein
LRLAFKTNLTSKPNRSRTNFKSVASFIGLLSFPTLYKAFPITRAVRRSLITGGVTTGGGEITTGGGEITTGGGEITTGGGEITTGGGEITTGGGDSGRIGRGIGRICGIGFGLGLVGGNACARALRSRFSWKYPDALIPGIRSTPQTIALNPNKPPCLANLTIINL